MNNVTKEFITIGIPCYNAEKTIGRAIQSALNQDWGQTEIIVVNDASSDNSLTIANQMAAYYSTVRVINLDINIGVGAVRNLIVSEANGIWVAFFDDDDVSKKERVRLQRHRIVDYEKQSGSDFILCYASGNRTYPNGYKFKINAIGSKQIIPKGEAVADFLLFNKRRKGLFYGRGTPASALMARKSTILKIGNFDPAFRRVEDADLAIRIAIRDGIFIGCPETLYMQNATTGKDKTPFENYKAETQLIEKHKKYLRSRKRYNYANDWFFFRYNYFSKAWGKTFVALAKVWIRNPYLVTIHLLRSVPKRIRHELKIARTD
jgi:glycosyltransferase involved in cell wall biosynthesis